MSAAFFDTNVVIYAVDPRDDSYEKGQVARRLMKTRAIALSTQVLMEAFNTLVGRRLRDRAFTTAYVEEIASGPVVSIEREDVLAALDISARHQINHWDGLILRAAEKAQAEIIYTEDLTHGERYGPVRACNPFIEDFLETASR